MTLSFGLALVLLLPQGEEALTPSEELYRQATSLYDTRLYQEALVRFQQLSIAEPSSPLGCSARYVALMCGSIGPLNPPRGTRHAMTARYVVVMCAPPQSPQGAAGAAPGAMLRIASLKRRRPLQLQPSIAEPAAPCCTRGKEEALPLPPGLSRRPSPHTHKPREQHPRWPAPA